MTLFDLRLLFEHWAKHPPADDILKAVYRIETRPKEFSAPAQPPDIDFGPGVHGRAISGSSGQELQGVVTHGQFL